jgi:reductive dehalogenase
MRIFTRRKRRVDLGPYPMERLRRAAPAQASGTRPHRPAGPPIGGGFGAAAAFYGGLYDNLTTGEVLPADTAVLVNDAAAITRELKAAAYFLNADVVTSGPAEEDLWFATDTEGRPLPPYHRSVLVIAVAHGRSPDAENPAFGWLTGAEGAGAGVRATQIAVILAGYLRALGQDARAHTPRAGDIDLAAAATRTGLALRRGGDLRNPFIGSGFALAAVTTAVALTDDGPLATRQPWDWRYLVGWGGTASALERWQARRRALHLGQYPMEHVQRRATPTTLIFDDEVPQVSARALFYARAAHGDLGDKAKTEVFRFVRKHPLALAIRPVIDAAVPHQDGVVARPAVPGLSDPVANARAVKALCHHLGAEIVGIGPAPRYVWYSHDKRGAAITQHHPQAIVLAIDQGHETMEGSSGDDWISGSQSSRAYMRGAEIAGMVARHLRALGYAARAHSNVDSQVLHTPLLLLCGIGELSRIGEVVLNPFIGPRFKSAVITTDMPLAHDRPIDFGLQETCAACRKCARECPCTAISFGGKVIFNGYEIWKPDVERCTRYRLTNAKGSSCGRCIKVCPYNHEGLLSHRAALWAAIRLPWFRRWIPVLDDWIGHGVINPIKTWWSDWEVIGGRGSPARTVRPAKGTNRRSLNPDKTARLQDNQTIAYYHANMMPPPNLPDPSPIDRDAALQAAALVETPAQALARRAAGHPVPEHYRPPDPLPDSAVHGRKLISN